MNYNFHFEENFDMHLHCIALTALHCAVQVHFDQVNFDEMHLYVYFLVHPNDFHFKVQFEVHIVMQIEVTFEVHFQVHFDEV